MQGYDIWAEWYLIGPLFPHGGRRQILQPSLDYIVTVLVPHEGLVRPGNIYEDSWKSLGHHGFVIAVVTNTFVYLDLEGRVIVCAIRPHIELLPLVDAVVVWDEGLTDKIIDMTRKFIRVFNRTIVELQRLAIFKTACLWRPSVLVNLYRNGADTVHVSRSVLRVTVPYIDHHAEGVTFTLCLLSNCKVELRALG